MTFEQFLMYCQGEGLSAVVGVLLSFLVEWWPDFQELESRLKKVVMAGLSVGVPVLAATVGALMGYQTWGFEGTFWPAIASGVLGFLGSQMTYATGAPETLAKKLRG